MLAFSEKLVYNDNINLAVQQTYRPDKVGGAWNTLFREGKPHMRLEVSQSGRR